MLNFRGSGDNDRKLLATWKLVLLQEHAADGLRSRFLFELLEAFLCNAANPTNMHADNIIGGLRYMVQFHYCDCPYRIMILL